jgi:peptide deformylase
MGKLKMERGKDNPILRTRSSEVKKIDRKLLKFIEEMKVTMDEENGIGLAAPQVGANIRVVICKFNPGTPNELIVSMINPKILKTSEAMELNEEGCLSLPKQFDSIARYTALSVNYKDAKGKENILKLSGLNARIVQHEIDHIDGKLFIDHLKDDVTVELKKKISNGQAKV